MISIALRSAGLMAVIFAAKLVEAVGVELTTGLAQRAFDGWADYIMGLALVLFFPGMFGLTRKAPDAPA